MYMFSRNAQQGTGNLTKQQASIAAQEILNYARLVEGAVDRVRRNGCSETEISFENDVVPGYEHTPPARDECKVFDDAGGKVSYTPSIELWLDEQSDTEGSYGHFYFVAENNVSQLAVHNQDDLLIQTSWLKQDVCEEINNLIYDDKTITEDPSGFFQGHAIGKAIGTFQNNSGNINLTSYSPHGGQETACFESEDFGGYHFYHVLLAR